MSSKSILVRSDPDYAAARSALETMKARLLELDRFIQPGSSFEQGEATMKAALEAAVVVFDALIPPGNGK